MPTRLLFLPLVALTIVGASPAVAEDNPPPAVALRTATVDRVDVVEAVLPGRVLATAPWPGGGLAVLVATEAPATETPEPEDASGDPPDSGPDDGHDPDPDDDRPRALYRLRTEAEASDLDPLASELPATIDAVARVGDRLLIGATDDDGDGRVWQWTDGGLDLLFEHPAVDLGRLRQDGLIDDQGLALPEVGRLSLHRLDGESTIEHTPIPATARRCSTGFELTSPPIERLRMPGSRRFVAGPVAAGPHRVRSLIIDPAAADDEERVIETWSRLPSPEDVDAHHYLSIDGRPFLIAITTDAERLGVFEKSKLRVLPLGGDRTRAGRAATFQLETDTRNWYSVGVEVFDDDGDGRDDLLVLQPQGLSGGDLVVERFAGLGNGRFDRRSRKTELDDVEGARWIAGRDWTGDGRADLWVVAESQLRLYAGIEHRRRTVAKDPIRVLDATTTERAASTLAEHPGHVDAPTRMAYRGRPKVDDLDADGHPKITLVRHVRGRGLVRIVSPR